MSAGSIAPDSQITSTLARWYRLLALLIIVLAVEFAFAGIIRIGVLIETFTGERRFGFLEMLSLAALVASFVLVYAIVRIRKAQHELDVLVKREQEAAAALKQLLDTTAEGIFAVDLEGRCTMANKAAGEFLGYSPQQLIGEEMHDLIHDVLQEGATHPRDSCPILRAITDAEPRRVEDELMRRKDGNSFSASYSAAPLIQDGTVYGAVVSFTDIDERKRMEAAAQESMARTRRYLDDLPLAVFIVDEHGSPVYSNKASVTLLGLDADGSVSGAELARAYDAYIAGTDEMYPTERLPIVRALAGETGTVDDMEIRRPDGTRLPLEVWAGPIRDDDGHIRYAAAAFSDITSRKEAADAIVAAGEEAERANLAKSEFLSRMSHELRTPLNAILGFAQLLEMDALSSDQRESVEQIIKAGRRLLELINEVLDIARIESGRLALSLEPVLVRELIDECVDLIHPLAHERNIAVDSECREVTEHVWGDRYRLGQVVLNLLSNAVKYNVDGGSVTITCNQPDDKVFRVGVTDTGPGIPPEKLPLLFTPFERLGAEGSGVEGTGLGLALSKSLVEAMGGSIYVDTTEGRGTTFWMELGTTEEVHVAPIDAPFCESDVPSGQFRILYIEDNVANMKLIEKLLERQPGFEIIPAMTGALGLDLAREHRPDLILLDLGLPDMRGNEVLARLRKDVRTAGIPVVILSADATPGEIKRLLAAGAADYLTKPIDVGVFMRVLTNTIATGDVSASLDRSSDPEHLTVVPRGSGT